MVAEARVEETEHGLVPQDEGWFVLNARDARWRSAPGRGAVVVFEGEDRAQFRQLGANLFVLGPREPMSMYHWEADQEDFLVLAGEALLVVEGEERPLRAWDLVHCPPDTKHTIIGAGSGPAVILAVGSREHADSPDWGGYPVDDVAHRHEAGVDQETNDPHEAYSRVPHRKPTRYEDGWLPG